MLLSKNSNRDAAITTAMQQTESATYFAAELHR